MKKALVALTVILALLSYTLYTQQKTLRSPQKEFRAAVGYYAPDFTLMDASGHALRLSSIKKPVLLSFWTSWCGPCHIETPQLIRLYKAYQGKFEIVAVNVTLNDKKQNARTFADFFGVPYPVVFDEKGDVTELYHVQGYPTNVFIDEHGKITRIETGVLPPKELETVIRTLVTP
ncbi:TlpA family protein disulfide reductase [Aneurinibacillus uraniidurans]|uniref:TlpA family protein disulfide reductase n=1 Tax=Aneurinibacillus uraniidurans TaxID=2966586 RepID=UPI00234ABE02|nr:TlpA disulfide reductase family protein [Aneurinibacillus sp. B1]WCN38824.1 TlpA disulfide reductase family protein [Aneurinibacillus sp. B1]